MLKRIPFISASPNALPSPVSSISARRSGQSHSYCPNPVGELTLGFVLNFFDGSERWLMKYHVSAFLESRWSKLLRIARLCASDGCAQARKTSFDSIQFHSLWVAARKSDWPLPALSFREESSTLHCKLDRPGFLGAPVDLLGTSYALPMDFLELRTSWEAQDPNLVP